MAAFAALSIGAAVITAVTVASFASSHMHHQLRDKAIQYSRQLQRQMEPVIAYDDHVTAAEAFDSLMGDSDVDALGVYKQDGELIEGRGSVPSTLPSINSNIPTDAGHVIGVAEIRSREGREGRVLVRLTSRPIEDLARRNALFAAAIAGAVALCALLLASKLSQRITQRLERIADAAKRIAAGDREHISLEDFTQDSIGALAQAFNTMVRDLDKLSAEHQRLVATERERLEHLVSERTQALEQSREMFKLIAESTHAVPFTLDLTRGSFPYIGFQGVSNFRIPESDWAQPGVLERALPRLDNEELRRQLDASVDGAFEFPAEIHYPGDRRAEVRWMGTCVITNECKILRGLILDVTETRRLERELTAAQKLESVGRLASGVAHEINTPVQFVADNVEFVATSMTSLTAVIQTYRTLLIAVQSAADAAPAVAAAERVESDEDIPFILANIPPALAGAKEGLGRIATIVRSMKEFAHPDQAEKSAVDLNRAVEGTLAIACNEYKYVAALDTDFHELPPVYCYLGEINQAILNLLVNAAHAIGDVVKVTGEMGRLTVRTRALDKEVEISITDTGTGIPLAAQEKIFDPFFTTKEVGKGTGQGLAIARSVIVNKHGGSLRFETEMGKGTTFFLRLPIGGRDAAADLAA